MKKYIAIIDGKIIIAKTFTALKRLASIEANKKYRAYDEFYLIFAGGLSACPKLFVRRNVKAPNNTIKRGQWR